jgi:Sigma-70 region 2
MVEEGRTTKRLLIPRILAGERECFHELIRPYERGAFVLAYAILRNHEDAEEAVQQAMLNIFSRLAQLDEVDKFKQWATVEQILPQSALSPLLCAEWLKAPDGIGEHNNKGE